METRRRAQAVTQHVVERLTLEELACKRRARCVRDRVCARVDGYIVSICVCKDHHSFSL